MKSIGLTGGIGSGKSVVSRVFEVLDIPVYYTDDEAKRIMVESNIVKEKLCERFGNQIYKDNILNRSLLSKLIFNNKENLEFTNSVVHPEVSKDFLLWKERNKNHRYTVVESAILFESGLSKLVDITVTVTAPLEKRIERIQKRDQVSREDVLRRIANQMPQEEKESLANYVIVNDDIQPLLPQIENLAGDKSF